MLVLSRKEDQKVFIPGLDIAIKVIRCKNSSVMLGFDAPPEIRIVRDELEPGVSVADAKLAKFFQSKILAYPSAVRHEIRDQLNVVAMSLQMLLDDIDSGELTDVDEIFDRVCQRLGELKATPNDSDACVLVVEDEENERELLAGILRMNGYHVATATNGAEAMDFLQNNDTPTFVLVDMNMPGGHGADLVREIRESADFSDVRVYVVSGMDRSESDLSIESVDGWYAKPLAPQKLIRAMSTACS